MENIFINGRYVKSRTAAAALEQAYVSRIPSDKFPFCVLNIELNPGTVDVNVHPSKLEVKFTNERVIFDAVYYAVLSALEREGSRPELNLGGRYAAETPKPPLTGTDSSAAAYRTEQHRVNTYEANNTAGKSYGTTAPQSARAAGSGAFWLTDQQARELINAMKPVGERKNMPLDKMQMKLEPKGSEPIKHAESVEPPVQANSKAWQPTPSVNIPETTKITEPATTEPRYDNEMRQPTPTTENHTETREADVQTLSIPDYIIIGEAFNCYVIIQIDDKLLMIDKHAAHERILYEDMRRKMHAKDKHPQLLMFPLEIQMDDTSFAALDEYSDDVKGLGFDYQKDVIAKKLLVNQIPEELGRESAVAMMESLVNSLADGTGNPDAAKAEFFDRILYRAACKAAIKGGRMYGSDQIKWICDKLLATPLHGENAIKTCPHGRPVAFEITKNSIERQFERQK